MVLIEWQWEKSYKNNEQESIGGRSLSRMMGEKLQAIKGSREFQEVVQSDRIALKESLS